MCKDLSDRSPVHKLKDCVFRVHGLCVTLISVNNLLRLSTEASIPSLTFSEKTALETVRILTCLIYEKVIICRGQHSLIPKQFNISIFV